MPDQEVKTGSPSVNQTMDSFFEKTETPQENSPESTPTPEPEANVDDTVKNGEADETQGDVETGGKLPETIPYQKFQSVVKQRQEFEAKAKQLEQESTRYAKLLDDPATYKKFLELQGFRPEEIAQAMAEKGFQVEATQPKLPAGTTQDIAEATCKKLGWDITRLNTEQRAYVNDQISLIKAVAEDMFGEKLNERLRPMEGFLEQQQTMQRVSKGYDEAKREAKTEFPDLDWDKDIEPAMAKYLDELDKRDPKGSIQIDAMTLYEKATRQLLKEKKVSEGRQEVRNSLKKNARPLVVNSQALQGDRAKGKSVRETADSFLDHLGLKND